MSEAETRLARTDGRRSGGIRPRRDGLDDIRLRSDPRLDTGDRSEDRALKGRNDQVSALRLVDGIQECVRIHVAQRLQELERKVAADH